MLYEGRQKKKTSAISPAEVTEVSLETSQTQAQSKQRKNLIPAPIPHQHFHEGGVRGSVSAVPNRLRCSSGHLHLFAGLPPTCCNTVLVSIPPPLHSFLPPLVWSIGL